MNFTFQNKKIIFAFLTIIVIIILVGGYWFFTKGKQDEASASPTPSPTPVSFSVTGVTAAVSPTSYTGTCPKKFEFTANITANAAGTVTYKWARSDGAGAPTETLTFASAGTQAASPDDWTLSSPGTKWEKIQILTPNSIESNQATFNLACS